MAHITPEPGGDGDFQTWLVRLLSAGIWLVMVWDLFDRVGDGAPASSILVSFGLLTFVTMTVLLPITFSKSRPERGTPGRWAWDAVVIAAALVALAGLLIRTLGR